MDTEKAAGAFLGGFSVSETESIMDSAYKADDAYL